MSYKEICIGIDQSYQNVGICIIADNKKKLIKSIDLDKVKTKSEKRKIIHDELSAVAKFCLSKSQKVICIIERIRLQSQGFVNINYIKSIGALNSVIVDVMTLHNIETYSVDTRCWKSQVIGTSKPAANKFSVPEQKWPTIAWCISNGWESDILQEVTSRKCAETFINKEGKKMKYNNDAADAAGIASYYFKGNLSMLKKEE